MSFPCLWEFQFVVICFSSQKQMNKWFFSENSSEATVDLLLQQIKTTMRILVHLPPSVYVICVLWICAFDMKLRIFAETHCPSRYKALTSWASLMKLVSFCHAFAKIVQKAIKATVQVPHYEGYGHQLSQMCDLCLKWENIAFVAKKDVVFSEREG